MTLDSAYEARDLDPWYRTTLTTARRAFDRSAAAPGLPGRRARRSLAPDRSARAGCDTVPSPAFRSASTTAGITCAVNATALVNLVNDAGYDYQPYRDLDAAARAYLDQGDQAPLLRLWAQDIGWDDSDYVAPASYYSDGNYYAVACTDYPQLFDMHASRVTRVKQLEMPRQALPRNTFAPFTIKQWLTVQPYTETYDSCLDWPAPTHPALPPVPAGPMDRTHVPVLILNGSLDSLTPAAGGAHIARQIGSAARAVVVPNTVHLVALDNPHPCGEDLVRRFIAHPSRLHTMSVSCIHQVPAIDVIGRYPRTVSAAQPGTGSRAAAPAQAGVGRDRGGR